MTWLLQQVITLWLMASIIVGAAIMLRAAWRLTGK